MKASVAIPNKAIPALRIISALTVVVIAALIALGIYYLAKPVGPEGHNCALDTIACESNVNIATAISFFLYALLAISMWVVFRFSIWLASKQTRHDPRP